MYKESLSGGIARAKINLHLQVLNRRKDNFHNLFSIMAEVEIFDLLKLESIDIIQGGNEREVEIISSGGRYASALDGLTSERNLISLAVKDYLRRSDLGGYIKFSLEKNIPSGAGLGGGSSDAAEALKMVMAALKREPDHDLFSAALSTGSDIPFFLSGGIAFAEGRGEILQQIEQEPGYYVLLVNNGIHINTGAAYSSLGRERELPVAMADMELRKARLETVLADISLWRETFINDFEGPVFELYPELGILKQSFYDLGADFALMSGSGSTVYGIFRDRMVAENSAKELESRGNMLILTKMYPRKINY